MAVSPHILAILGPTASGKSALAMAVARQTGRQILSVDSMQVYYGMDIGTAKPAAAERKEIPHHLIDIVQPSEEFTVARFVESASNIINKKIPLIATGGTPLYYKSLFHGLFEGPSADSKIRDQLRVESGEELHRRLAAIDSAAAARIHQNDTRRLIRALEVFELTGKTISSLQTDWQSPADLHAAVWIGLMWDKETLSRRINLRVKQMIADGWLDETRSLLDRFGHLSPTAGKATGYAELIEHLHGKYSLDEAIEQIKIATRQLARRQMKWFRRFPHVHWINGDRPLEQILADTLAIADAAKGG